MSVLNNVFSKNGASWVMNYFFILTRPLKLFPVKWQLYFTYRCAHGKSPHFSHPATFNEKLAWRKLNAHNPLYSKMVDKYEAKAIVSKLIGEEYIVPCYGVWNNFDDINFDSLPKQFILKCTHDSSGIVLCKDKDLFNREEAKKIIDKSLTTDYYSKSFEWPYKDASQRVLADKLLIDGTRKELQDYKWWCFNGEPKVMYITNKGKYQQCEENFYDMDFKPLDIDHGFPRSVPEYEKPPLFEKMRELAGVLAQDIPFVRIDFFVVESKIFFGEFTFFDHAGMRPFKDDRWDETLGSWIKM